MLISFRVCNFRSFAQDAILSMRPVRAYHEHVENVCKKGDVEVLKTAAVFGPNASGKSNLIKAIGRMRYLVLNSLKMNSIDELHVEPFLLNDKTRTEPTQFEATILVNDHVYRYGFVLTSKAIVAEWLFVSTGGPRAKERLLFVREGQKLEEFNKTSMEQLTNFPLKTLLPNALLLPRLDQVNNVHAKNVLTWFSRLSVLSGVREGSYGAYSAEHFTDKELHENMLKLVRFADLTINDVRTDSKEISFEDLPAEIRLQIPPEARSVRSKEVTISAVRKDNQGIPIQFDFEKDESEGTLKMFAISGPIANILHKGSVLAIDELESKLHPLLTRRIVRLFNSNKTNPNNAQLIFVSHDATLLRSAGLRRDQIWYCEKSRACESSLYCQAEIKSSAKARREDNLEKKYLEGRFGAIPEFAEEVV